MRYEASGAINIGGAAVCWWRKFRPYQFAYTREGLRRGYMERVCIKRSIAPNFHDGVEIHTYLDTLNRFWFEEELYTEDEVLLAIENAE